MNYRALATRRERLDRYLGQVAALGPQSTPALFPTPSDRMCYYMNVYNACVLRVVLERYPLTELQDVWTRRLEHGFLFAIDRRGFTLAAIRARLQAAAAGDVRVRFGLSQGTLGSPAPPERSYRPNAMREQLRFAVRRALGNPHLVRADDDDRVLYLWAPLVFERHKFVRFYRRHSASRSGNVLDFLALFADRPAREWLHQVRRYRVKVMPLNRRLNDGGPANRPAR